MRNRVKGVKGVKGVQGVKGVKGVKVKGLFSGFIFRVFSQSF